MTITLTDPTEKTLREYIAKKYPTEIYGKIGEVFDDAVKEYLQNHPIEE